MATFREVLIKAIQSDKCKLISVNQKLMGVSKSTKNKPAFIKVAVPDETAMNYLAIKHKDSGFLLHIDGDYLEQLRKEIDEAAEEKAVGL